MAGSSGFIAMRRLWIVLNKRKYLFCIMITIAFAGRLLEGIS